jgi:putative phosphoribosyl transferase
MLYRDRKDGGEKLVLSLYAFKDQEQTLVVGVGKGGIVTAIPIATALNLPLNFLLVSRVANLNNEKVSLGVITETGVEIRNERLNPLFGYSSEMISRLMRMELSRTQAFATACREEGYPLNFEGYKRAILIDDGIATGITIKAAILSLQRLKIEKLVIASPIASPNSIVDLKKIVDDIRVLSIPFFFVNFETYYEEFAPVQDREVLELLAMASPV